MDKIKTVLTLIEEIFIYIGVYIHDLLFKNENDE